MVRESGATARRATNTLTPMNETQNLDLPKIGRPATTALANVGITTLTGAASFGRTAVLELHGVGPKALRLLDEALATHHLTWSDQ